MLDEILKLLGGGAVILGGVWWIATTLVERSMKRGLEAYRAQLGKEAAAHQAQLRHDHDLAVEQLKREALEHEIRYRRVDAVVAKRLEEVYSRLLKLDQAVKGFLGHSAPISQKRHLEDRLLEANAELLEYLLHERLNVPPGLYDGTKELAHQLTELAYRAQANAQRSGERDDKWIELFVQFRNRTQPLLDALVADYQKRLGIQDTPGYEPALPKQTYRVINAFFPRTVTDEPASAEPEPDTPTASAEPRTEPDTPADTAEPPADHDTTDRSVNVAP